MKGKHFLVVCAGILFVLTVFFSQPIYAQREDYKTRELKVSPQIKQLLLAQRKRIQARKLKFQVGYTYALERGIKNVTGGIKPTATAAAARKQNALAAQVLQIESEALKRAGRVVFPISSCSARSRFWDWRRQNKVTPVRLQRCGNCWAYAGLAAYESSYLIQNNRTVDGSEQFIVSNNTNGGSCGGGSTDSQTMPLLVERGTTSEAVLPDGGTNGTPDSKMATPYNAVIWGWADPDRVDKPGVEKIQQAICENGAVATFIDAGGTFGSYTGANEYGDVYNDDDDKEAGYNPSNHFVAIIGWDDDRGAWLVKNSWGQTWGFEAGFGTERGYGWIAYNTHQVGTYVSWVRAETSGITLPKEYFELLPYKRKPLIPIPPVIIKKPLKTINLNKPGN